MKGPRERTKPDPPDDLPKLFKHCVEISTQEREAFLAKLTPAVSQQLRDLLRSHSQIEKDDSDTDYEAPSGDNRGFFARRGPWFRRFLYLDIIVALLYIVLLFRVGTDIHLLIMDAEGPSAFLAT